MLFDDPEWEHEYPASHLGEAEFRDLSARLLFGDESQTVREKRQASPRFNSPRCPWLIDSFQTSINAGSGRQRGLPHGCQVSAEALRAWQRLAHTFQAKQHFAFLDLSYPGFVSGSVAKDCMPIRIFDEVEIPLLVAATYGKMLGLYGERVGYLCLSLPTAEAAARSEQQMKLLARAETGAQPRFGARLVSNILGTPRLKAQWEEDIKRLAEDLADRRKKLKIELLRGNSEHDWDFVTSQAGMFL
ncbi:unnamed protein product [Aspergillus oryzae]|nr:unnamed protein product [Aspergillus oryzae]GMF92054.1 unnamed protein product [Aspergillus oryzae]